MFPHGLSKPPVASFFWNINQSKECNSEGGLLFDQAILFVGFFFSDIVMADLRISHPIFCNSANQGLGKNIGVFIPTLGILFLIYLNFGGLIVENRLAQFFTTKGEHSNL